MIITGRDSFKNVTFCHFGTATETQGTRILQTEKIKGGYDGTIIECM